MTRNRKEGTDETPTVIARISCVFHGDSCGVPECRNLVSTSLSNPSYVKVVGDPMVKEGEP